MKATIVLIADVNAENYGRRIMLEAHKAGNVGFEMARLPQHVSLKQPFSIPGLEEIESFFDEFAKGFAPVEVEFDILEVLPSNVLGGTPSGCMSIRAIRSETLDHLQKELFRRLEERFGSCPAEHDNDYVFHMTVALGGASFEQYQKAYDTLVSYDFHRKLRFDKIGLFYYDDDAIKPGTYFCLKVAEF
ncbi:MAG: 2'-5' RNA ligase family protein [Acetatifactor sp.]|nr:2'-5' RNA ligase family protein [Acetatifactor sp.]